MVEKEEIARAVAAELEKARTINVETHRKHHEFMEYMIERQKRSDARKEKIIQTVAGWGVITALTGLGLAIWHYLKQNLNG